MRNRRTPPINVLPMVNKGLAIFQWKSDVRAAEQCIREALEADPECEAAIATLAQLQLQQGNFEEAAKMFHKQVDIARTPPDLQMALQFALVRSYILSMRAGLQTSEDWGIAGAFEDTPPKSLCGRLKSGR